MRRLIQLLVHATSKVQYERFKSELFEQANDKFKVYFGKNWEGCRSMWVAYQRDEHLHFANTTNNRLESYNQKLKDVTSRTSSLSDLFKNVLLYCRSSAAECSQQSFTEEFTAQYCGDKETEITQEIRSVCTQYAADLILKQLELAESIPYEITIDETEVVLKYKEHSHLVSLSSNSCSCTFRRTLLMPCRHAGCKNSHWNCFVRTIPGSRKMAQGLSTVCWYQSY